MSEEVKQEGEFKVASKRKTPSFKSKRESDEVYKVDLTKKEDAVQEQQTEESVLRSSEESQETREETKVGLQEVGETHEESKEEQEVIIGETRNEVVENNYERELKQLPDNVQKLVSFMEDTGGTLQDYIRLNSDYSNVDDLALLKEYYKSTKSHLNNDEVEFLIADNFGYLDEESDNVKRKKDLAKKEEIAKARKFLVDLKDKYYDEIKLRPSSNPEQQKAMDFFNRYNEQQKAVNAQYEMDLKYYT